MSLHYDGDPATSSPCACSEAVTVANATRLYEQACRVAFTTSHPAWRLYEQVRRRLPSPIAATMPQRLPEEVGQ